MFLWNIFITILISIPAWFCMLLVWTEFNDNKNVIRDINGQFHKNPFYHKLGVCIGVTIMVIITIYIEYIYINMCVLK